MLETLSPYHAGIESSVVLFFPLDTHFTAEDPGLQRESDSLTVPVRPTATVRSTVEITPRK